MTELEELEMLGRRLFGRPPDGYGWKTAMERELEIPRRTIQDYGRRTPVHRGVLNLMRMLADERNQRVAGMDGEKV
ncbi:hypothetical protein [Paludisphaera rhizosphaerae]|uniref:hypothetical protein n=1 Tax=Paludisphaera rhizosphaerae TaxID=2711216 RepID=UPI0013EE1E30|nr:hypothetical protein [Paludisphaera rhizosphaerae]